MKILVLTFASFLIQLNLNAQTAEEIIAQTENTYRHLVNYVDEGEYTVSSLGGPKHDRTIHYFLALDSSENVNHRFSEIQYNNTRGYSYLKTADQEEGIFTRHIESSESFPSTLGMATASMVGGGDIILFVVGSLIYSNMYEAIGVNTKAPGAFYPYTDVKRLQDTVIEGQPCYRIELTNQFEITQAKIDQTKRYLDSMNYVKALETTPTAKLSAFEGSSHYNEEPGTKTTVSIYFIRKKDNLIIRRENQLANGSEKYYLLAFQLNPKVNVENFQEYLSQK